MNVSFSSPSLLFPEQFSKRFVVGEALVERDDSVPNECKSTVGNLCVEVGTLASAKFKVLLLYKHLVRDTLAIYRKACGFIPEQCDDVYGSILDASDFLYKQ